MKISFIPRYSRSAASSRLRVFVIAEAINQYGIAEAYLDFQPDADILVIQKSVDPTVFARAESFRGRVVYDVDDVIDSSVFARACEVAHLITVDTAGRGLDLAERLTANGRARRVSVIPDALDYEGSGPRPVVVPRDASSAVWFGNYPNFDSARWMMQTLQSRNIPVGAISDISPQRAAEWGMHQMELVAWSLDAFPSELRKWGMAVLSHRGADPFKSVNKMAAAYHLGVPSIVSGSEAYKDLAKECGVGWTYVSDIAGLLAAWDVLRDVGARADTVAAVQPVIWEKYRAEVVARQALEVYANA